MPQVGDEQLAEAAAAMETAKVAVAEADARVDHLQPLLEQSKQWAELQTDLASSETELGKLDSLLSRALTLETGAERLRELNAVLPKLCHALEVRGQGTSAETALKKLNARQIEATAAQTALTQQIASARDAQANAVAEAY